MKRLKASIFFVTLTVTISAFAAPSSAQIPIRKGAIQNCGRVIDDWSPEEATDPATLIDLYLSDYDLETSTGVDAALRFVHGQLEFMQDKLDGLKDHASRATMHELDSQLRQVSVLAVILKNAKSSFLGRRVEN